jgi:DNA-binding beta-propeller fold protein YncE
LAPRGFDSAIFHGSSAPLLALWTVALVSAGCSPAQPSSSGDVKPASNPGKTEIKEELIEPVVVVDGLTNPSGVAVQPGTGHVFVSSKDGIARVVPGDKPGLHWEVVGFATDSYGRGPTYEFGPLGLAFFDADTLVVGDGSLPDGDEIVRFYAVGKEPLPKDMVRKADDMLRSAGPIGPGPDSVHGEGNFHGVALIGNTIYVTCNGDDTKGWVSKVDYDKNKPSPLPLTPYIKTKVLTGVDGPMGITVDPKGQLLISQFGRSATVLGFYDPASGKLVTKLQPALHNICGVAYSPKTGKLYVTDFSWDDASKGGLFRCDIDGDKAALTRIASLDRPTALAFAPDGTLYVTVIGAAAKDGKPGQVVRFKGL